MLYAAQPFDDNAVGGVLSLAKEPKRFPKSERAAPIPAITSQNALAVMHFLYTQRYSMATAFKSLRWLPTRVTHGHDFGTAAPMALLC